METFFVNICRRRRNCACTFEREIFKIGCNVGFKFGVNDNYEEFFFHTCFLAMIQSLVRLIEREQKKFFTIEIGVCDSQ